MKINCIARELYKLFVKCWTEEHITQDMRDANIVTLYKGKGDHSDCNSYHGISLLSFADMILTFRQLQEKFREQKSHIVVAFVDINKAFDTVSMEG